MSPAGQFTIMMDTPGLLESIEAKLERPRPDCLIWPGAADRGYGRVWVDGQAKRTHRVVWELKNGPIPAGLTIDHLCRIRACCNTEHMELVTLGENARRAHPHRQRVTLGSRNPRLVRPPIEVRVMDRCTVTEDGHWLFGGAIHPRGYGQISKGGRGAALTHRVMWESWHGPVPAGFVVSHLCDQKTCCNPEHLQLTQKGSKSRRLAA